MKHIVAILLVLLLAVPCVAEQAFSPYDYVTGSAGGGRYLYYDFTDEDHMVEYELHGHAEDVENLKPTGRTFDRKWN